MKKFNKELIIKAHKLTKEIKAEYKDVDYKFQFGLVIKYLLSENKEESKIVELKGSEKQIKWAKDIITRWRDIIDSNTVENMLYVVPFRAYDIEKEEVVKELESIIEQHKDAAFYIDKRAWDAGYLIETVVERLSHKFILKKENPKTLGKLVSVLKEYGSNVDILSNALFIFMDDYTIDDEYEKLFNKIYEELFK